MKRTKNCINRKRKSGISKLNTVFSILVLTLIVGPTCVVADTREVDVCVYAATPSGINAAIAVKRNGYEVVIVEPSRWVGGILGAGIKPMQDCPNYEAVGGMTRPLLVELGEDPLAIRKSYLALLKKEGIPIIYEHRVSRVKKQGTNIRKAIFDLAPPDAEGCPIAEPEIAESLSVTAQVFIDASYEGELMARAGVSYRVARESRADYDEVYAGVYTLNRITPLDPFVIPGDRSSGLLPLVEDDHGKPLGAGDQYTQAYNYRFYVTDDPEHRVPIEKPDDYDPAQFELIGRFIQVQDDRFNSRRLAEPLSWIFPGNRNRGEQNYARDGLFSISPLGSSHLYADGDYPAKARVWKAHQDYLKGLYHFLLEDPRVPNFFKEQTSKLGLDIRHHPETNGWPHQLYIRVTRRMEGRYTLSLKDIYNQSQVKDSIGLAQYGVDIYPVRRIWFDYNGSTYVGNEGNMFIGQHEGPTRIPYPISYRMITPQEQECTNLLVPICFSATHLGYASARMEPVFMVVGESAGEAAVQAIKEQLPVQKIEVETLLNRLRQLNQRLEWPNS